MVSNPMKKQIQPSCGYRAALGDISECRADLDSEAQCGECAKLSFRLSSGLIHSVDH